MHTNAYVYFLCTHNIGVDGFYAIYDKYDTLNASVASEICMIIMAMKILEIRKFPRSMHTRQKTRPLWV